jgi:hypothetical protein
VPNNPTLQAINAAVRHGQQPTVICAALKWPNWIRARAFSICTTTDSPPAPFQLLNDKSHPLLRFRVRLTAEQRHLLAHPIFRRGKRIDIYGTGDETQETVLANSIADLTERPYDFPRQQL